VPQKIVEPLVILANRVPKRLRRALKVHCAEAGIQERHFIIEALEERLAKVTGKARTKSRRAPRTPGS
jgi:hypothetical protein